jgi:hypothetical protein
MRNLLLIPLLLSGCATTGSSTKGSSAGFQGTDVLNKRKAEIDEAAKAAMECMKVKAGEQSGKGGVFAVSADSAGKLKVQALKWDGPEPMKQCIVDTGNKTAITPLPGPSIGSLWDFIPPGEKPEPAKAPDDFGVKMQPLQAEMQEEVKVCGTQQLGVDFPATVDVAFVVYNDGKGYIPTIVSSDVKDAGPFESCVQDVVSHTKFPQVSVAKPFPTTMHFKIGVYGETRRVQ